MNPPSTYEVASRAIRVYLAFHSQNQKWLAHEVGMTSHQLSRRMTGKTPFTTDDIDDIAHVLGVTVDQLLVDGNVVFIAS
jgi:transcriptional regulator with XRE-family HTH domain